MQEKLKALQGTVYSICSPVRISCIYYQPFISSHNFPCKHLLYLMYLCHFIAPTKIATSVSCSQLTEVAPSLVFCLCSPSTDCADAFLHTLVVIIYIMQFVIQICIALTFYQLKPVQPFSSNLWHQQDIFVQRTVTLWIFSSFSDHSL